MLLMILDLFGENRRYGFFDAVSVNTLITLTVETY